MSKLNSKIKLFGFGCHNFDLAVYIGNQPHMLDYQKLSNVLPLTQGEVFNIGRQCGNGWRKIFNIYAKLLFVLDKKQFHFCQNTNLWQEYRDSTLLQAHSKTALLFSPPDLQTQSKKLHIICGRTYALNLLNKKLIVANLVWIDHEFAIDKEMNLIICPYFDYRQLSNIKIEYLATMLKHLNDQL